MIPLIGILLCVYLAFKGIEIFRMSYVDKDAPTGSLVLGILILLAGLVIALIFAILFIDSGASVPTIPRI